MIPSLDQGLDYILANHHKVKCKIGLKAAQIEGKGQTWSRRRIVMFPMMHFIDTQKSNKTTLTYTTVLEPGL
jgi:hypothetical protein